MKRNKVNRVNLVYLMVLVLLIALVGSVIVARYVTQVSGTGTANVASIVTSTDFHEFSVPLSLKPGTPQEYIFSVCNYKTVDGSDKVSEVEQNYSVDIEKSNNLPLKIKVTGVVAAGAGKKLLDGDCNFTSSICTLSGGIMPHTVKTKHTYTLTLTIPADATLTYEQAQEIDSLLIRVNAEQATPVVQ